jgi:hypothetical protein
MNQMSPTQIHDVLIPGSFLERLSNLSAAFLWLGVPAALLVSFGVPPVVVYPFLIIVLILFFHFSASLRTWARRRSSSAFGHLVTWLLLSIFFLIAKVRPGEQRAPTARE